MRIEAIKAKLDTKGAIVESDPDSIKQGDAAILELRLKRPICIEKFSDCAPLGRIILHDYSNPKCCSLIIGVVKEVFSDID